MANYASATLPAAILAAMSAANSFAEPIVVQPRVSVGMQDYEFKYDDLVVGTNNDSVTFRDGFDVGDRVAFGGAGVTVSRGRIFVDLSGQRARKGTQRSYQYISPLVPVGGNGHNHVLDFDFDREEFNASLGWAATPNMSLYAGYKKAESTIDNTLTPVLEGLAFFDTYVIGTQKSKLKYDGFFVGATYSAPVEALGGAFSIQSSVASLDGTDKGRFEGVTAYSVPGPPFLILVDPALLGLNFKFTGEAVGLNLGVSWTGNFGWLSEGLRKLSYTLGVDRSQYKFESDSQPRNDFEETVTRLRLDFRYPFTFGEE